MNAVWWLWQGLGLPFNPPVTAPPTPTSGRERTLVQLVRGNCPIHSCDSAPISLERLSDIHLFLLEHLEKILNITAPKELPDGPLVDLRCRPNDALDPIITILSTEEMVMFMQECSDNGTRFPRAWKEFQVSE